MASLGSTCSEWIVYEIPKPASEVHTAIYKRIRLLGLLTNPEAFGSTYERESCFPEATWVSRINTTGRHTLVSVIKDSVDEGSSPAIGTLSVLGPEMLAGVPQDPVYPEEIADEERKGEVDVYMLVGMWVEPEYRGKGVGRALVDRAVQIVKQAGAGNVGDMKPRIVLLLVHDDQHAAIHLYRKVGFVEKGGVGHGDKPSTWMASRLEW